MTATLIRVAACGIWFLNSVQQRDYAAAFASWLFVVALCLELR